MFFFKIIVVHDNKLVISICTYGDYNALFTSVVQTKNPYKWDTSA